MSARLLARVLTDGSDGAFGAVGVDHLVHLPASPVARPRLHAVEVNSFEGTRHLALFHAAAARNLERIRDGR